MGCRLNRCCCFNNSKDASFASGIYTGIISLVTIISVSLIGFVGELKTEYRFSFAIFIAALLLQILLFVFSMLLLYGVKKGKRILVIPWMLWMIINIIFQCVSIAIIFVLLAQIFHPGFIVVLLIQAILIGFNIICLIVVKTHYQNLSSTTNVNIDPPPNYEKYQMPA